jgi:hypothetical protein
MKKIIVPLLLASALATPAFANGFNQPSLLGALVSLGNHGSIANVAAKVASPNALADVKVGASQPSYGHDYGYGHGAPSSSLATLNVTVPGVAKANVAVGQQSGRSSTLLGVTANVLSGGVGNRGGW